MSAATTAAPGRRPYRGRLAPSPTGYLHLGHARTFWIAQQRAQKFGGTLVLRNEDLDRARCRKEFVAAMTEDLRWFGFQWQEGPDCGGALGPYIQSDRFDLYRAALEELKAGGFVYPCTCSRKDILNALAAPHDGDDQPIYPGTCRSRSPSTLNDQPSTRFNWRFRVPDGEIVSFVDRCQGEQRFVAGRDFGDFVIWRHDDSPAYQLAVVADDAAMRITEVVRGADLLASTARQLLLYRALGLSPPVFYHCPLMTDERGVRLAKRHDALSLRALRAQGATPETLRADWCLVNMESEAGLSEPVSPIPKSNRHSRRRFALAVLSVLLLVITLFLTLPSRPVPPFTWLTQVEMARLAHSGPFTRLKDKLMNLTAPLWRRYWNTQQQILIDSRLLTLSAAAADQTGLGAPVATNADGMHAWILSPAELSNLLQRLRTTPNASLLSRPRAQTAAGTSARTFFGNTVLVAGKNVPVGLTLEVSPKVRSGSIQLLLGVTSTESVPSPSANAAALSTNLAVACRVSLANSGGLVVAGGNTGDFRGTNYWLILSPTAVDARGQPIKL